jgi:hypothetical protein
MVWSSGLSGLVDSRSDVAREELVSLDDGNGDVHAFLLLGLSRSFLTDDEDRVLDDGSYPLIGRARAGFDVRVNSPVRGGTSSERNRHQGTFVFFIALRTQLRRPVS